MEMGVSRYYIGIDRAWSWILSMGKKEKRAISSGGRGGIVIDYNYTLMIFQKSL